VDPGNNTYTSLNGVLFNKAQSVLLACPGGLAGAFTIPSSVSSIGNVAFAGCRGLTEIIIPSTVTRLRDALPNVC
jgi:hypothetical protein